MQKVNWNHPSTLKLFKREVKQNPENLTAAFKSISKELGCSFASVSNKWYNKFRYEFEAFKLFSGKKKVQINTKNRRSPEPIAEVIVSTQKHDTIKVVTVRRYYAI